MSGSFFRMTSPSPVKQAFRASVKADPGEVALCAALSEAERSLASLRHKINFRVDNDASAADHAMLDEMRRIAGNILAAADEYQGRPS